MVHTVAATVIVVICRGDGPIAFNASTSRSPSRRAAPIDVSSSTRPMDASTEAAPAMTPRRGDRLLAGWATAYTSKRPPASADSRAAAASACAPGRSRTA
ncbi:hypothetical protein ACFY2H_40355 [Streptomyces griseofuscus]|uniref:hypothetical protein n=1 Tax=Streptomyces griseofuscus TaxID=146922 RepID=UPI0036B4D43D